ncbi:MAG: periplasmic heavy metal sensor [Opitutae bacterium]|nr:periplasmic heavy metal sensor [Opitutae bacterium]
MAPMKNFFLTVALVLAVGAAACAVFFHWRCDDTLHTAAQQRDAMAWLRTEFHLDEAQVAAIAKLHADYSEVCAEHCAAIGDARAELAQLQASGQAPTAALIAARTRVAERELVCRTAIAGHLRAVAKLMPPAEGERYLRLLLPRVANYDHHGAPNVRLDR